MRPEDLNHLRLLYAWAQAQFSEEELAQAEQELEEFTTEEVLDHASRATVSDRTTA